MNPIETHEEVTEPAKVSPTSAATLPDDDDEQQQQQHDDLRITRTSSSLSSSSRRIITRSAKKTTEQENNIELPISPISVPETSISENDVLFGRGGGTNRHAGNIFFRDLVSEHQPAYVQARKRDKTLIAKSIVAQVRSRNGRFLRKEDGKWVDVGDKKAAEKTSQALREGLSGRMREIVKEGGVGLQKLKKIGYSLYEDTITREDVQRRVQTLENRNIGILTSYQTTQESTHSISSRNNPRGGLQQDHHDPQEDSDCKFLFRS